MKKLALMSLLFVSTLLSAQEPIKIKLWQNGAPNDNGMTGQVENGPLYVAEPTIEVYPAKESNGLAIVMCPGGGYGHLAMAHEGHDMASWFNSQGITYAVLTYRMPNGNNEVPLSDAQQALPSCASTQKNGTSGSWASWEPLPADIWQVQPPPILQTPRPAPTSKSFSIRSSLWTRLILTWARTITC